MLEEIKAFENAFRNMKKASKQLDAVVIDKVAELSEESDWMSLLELTDTLPKNYRGSRRIYEIAGRIMEAEKWVI